MAVAYAPGRPAIWPGPSTAQRTSQTVCDGMKNDLHGHGIPMNSHRALGRHFLGFHKERRDDSSGIYGAWRGMQRSYTCCSQAYDPLSVCVSSIALMSAFQPNCVLS